jgi:hypothetical protein
MENNKISSLHDLSLRTICNYFGSFSHLYESMPTFIVEAIIAQLRADHRLSDARLMLLLVSQLTELDISGSLGILGTRELGYVRHFDTEKF